MSKVEAIVQLRAELTEATAERDRLRAFARWAYNESHSHVSEEDGSPETDLGDQSVKNEPQRTCLPAGAQGSERS